MTTGNSCNSEFGNGRKLEIPTDAASFAIRVQGHLDPTWSEWFEGMAITHTESGDTILSGHVVDQSALHGWLAKIRDLNLAIISVTRIDPDLEGSL